MEYHIFGYGSLLNHASLSKTIPDREYRPAIVRGYRRIFNCKDGVGRAADVLNLIKDGRARVNGVVFNVTEEELLKLKRREDVYNFEPVTAYDFTTGKKIGECLTSIDPYVNIDRKGELPDKDYFLTVRAAAYRISEAFGKIWDATTQVAEGEHVSEWLTNNPHYDSQPEKMPLSR